MVADVAFSDGAEDRVGQRVKPGIGVGMTNQSLVVVDAHAAKPDGLAGAPAMSVESLAHAGNPGAAHQPFGHVEVLGKGEFHQQRVSRRQGDPATVRLDHLGVVGWLAIGPAGVGRQQPVPAEGLGGLGAPQPITRRGGQARFGLTLQRVGDGQGGYRPVGAVERREDCLDMGLRDKGSGRVVHQNGLVGRAVDHHQARLHRLGTGRAAQRRAPAGEPCEGLRGEGFAIGADDHHEIARTGVQQGFNGPAQHGLAGDGAPLFREAGARPRAAAGGDDDD